MDSKNEQVNLQLPAEIGSILEAVGLETMIFAYNISATESKGRHVKLIPICIACSDREARHESSSKRAHVYDTGGLADCLNPPSISAEITSSPPCICCYLSSLNAASSRDASTHADTSPPSRPCLSKSELPVEIWENITEYLSREDIKSLRLVNRNLERCVSARLFKAVVVPFSVGLYGPKCSGEEKQASQRDSCSSWLPESRDLDVLPVFGRHIQEFGISFEFNEASLIDLPRKMINQGHESYWGRYDWPFPQYARFKDAAELERAADNTIAMKHALSYLTSVKHLALSMDAGLGWLNGPDLSSKTRILRPRHRIFPPLFRPHENLASEHLLWKFLKEFHVARDHHDIFQTLALTSLSADVEILNRNNRNDSSFRLPLSSLADLVALPASNFMHNDSSPQPPHTSITGMFVRRPGLSFIDGIPERFRDRPTEDYIYDSSPTNSNERPAHGSFSSGSTDTGTAFHQKGLIYTRSFMKNDIPLATESALHPRNLTKAQREWLMEAAWAKDAFLSSYMLSVIDNSASFANVRQLSLSRISSRHLGQMMRNEFWNSLKSLNSVSLQVIADYRNVRKAESGLIETIPIRPSKAVDEFYKLLYFCIVEKESITKLHLAWVDGGEHAEGICARNSHILPAPLTEIVGMRFNPSRDMMNAVIRMPYIEELTLSNCWTMPSVLEALCDDSNTPRLRSLALESMSLTADFREELRQQHAPIMQDHPPVQQLVFPQGHGALAGQVGINTHMISQRLSYLLVRATTSARDLVLLQATEGYAGWFIALHPDAQTQPGVEQQDSTALRQGSWPVLLERLTSIRQPSGKPLLLACRSVGYVCLYNSRRPQTSMLEGEVEYYLANRPSPNSPRRRVKARQNRLAEVMMKDDDRFHGRIAPTLRRAEMQKLREDWGFHKGWPLPDDAASDLSWSYSMEKWGDDGQESAMLDGVRAGVCRFSGVIKDLTCAEQTWH